MLVLGGCPPDFPGPWYTYWPYNNPGVMTSPSETPGWVYDMHFQTPAPLYPYCPSAVAAYNGANGYAPNPPYPATGFQPVGYYPNYWYGYGR